MITNSESVKSMKDFWMRYPWLAWSWMKQVYGGVWRNYHSMPDTKQIWYQWLFIEKSWFRFWFGIPFIIVMLPLCAFLAIFDSISEGIRTGNIIWGFIDAFLCIVFLIIFGMIGISYFKSQEEKK
jgi:hypothetical protein